MLSEELATAQSYEDFYNKNIQSFKEKSYVNIWKEVLNGLNIKKTDVIAKADMGYTYFYDILRGEKHPSRDTLVKLCLAIGLDIEACQKILYTYDWAYLYPHIKRDSVFMFAIEKKLTVEETNELLEKFGLKQL